MTNARSELELGVKVGPWDEEPSGSRADRRLLEAFLSRDEDAAEAAFRRIVDRHAPAVLQVCRDVLGDHHQAQDAAQAVFLILARQAESIRRRESLGSWLHGVSLRVARRARDREARRKTAERRNAETATPRLERLPAAGPLVHPELYEEVNRLPNHYRLPIVLCYFEGYTQEEAARILGWPYGTLQTRLHRGRRRLREALSQRDPEGAGLLAAIPGSRHASSDRPIQPDWAAETARAAVRFGRYGGSGSGSVDPSILQLAAGTTIAPALATSTVGLLGLCLAAAGLWIATRSINEQKPERRGAAVKTVVSAATPTGEAASGRAAAPATVVLPPKVNPAVSNAKPILAKPGFSVPGRIIHERRIVETSAAEPQPPDGRELFNRTWAPNDSRSHGGNGLGPVYNARSCADCHGQGGLGGAGPSSRNIDVATAVDAQDALGTGFFYGFRMDFGAGTMEYRFGGGAPAEADHDARVALAAAAIHPGFRDSNSVMLHHFGVDPAYAAWRGAIPGRHGRIDVRMSQRNPAPLFGVGLIDEIPDEAILAAARRRSSAAAQTRGRVHRAEGGRVGRFGWKAQTATLEEFVLSAAAGELGLDLPERRQAEDPRVPDAPSEGVDLDQAECAALVDFVRELPPPELAVPADPKEAASVKEGERIFRSIGCTACHLPKLGDVEGIYSDLLLHNMGAELADSSSGGYAVFGARPLQATQKDDDSPETHAGEWRTPPLWGLRDSAPYLHDGRAPTIARAVLMHGGQGQPSAERFARLSSRRRRQIEAFLGALAAPVEATDE